MRYVIFLVLVLTRFTLANNEINTPNPLLLQTYGSNDLSTKPVFQGGYINFGYWKNIFPNPVSPRLDCGVHGSFGQAKGKLTKSGK